MMTRLPTYVDRQGKPPAVPESMRLESADAVKLAKFFVALGFTAEKQTTAEGRQYILAKANGVLLSIVPSRTPTPADGWSMTLMVDDVAATAARAEATGGTVASPIKEIPGGRKGAVMSPDGYRIVIAERRNAAAPKQALSATSGPPSSPTPVAPRTVASAATKPAVIFDAIEFEAEVEPPTMRMPDVGAMKKASPAIDDEDAEAADDGRKVRYVADSDLDSLRRLRRAAGVTAGAFAFSVAVIVICTLVAGSPPAFNPSPAVEDKLLVSLSALAVIIGAFAIGFAKWSCRREMSPRIGNSVLVTIAFILDLASLAFALMMTASEEVRSPVLAIVGLLGNSLCGLMSPILFLGYLSQASRFVELPKLASSMRIVQLFLCFFAGFVILQIVAGVVRPQSRDIGDMLSLAGLGGMILTGLVGFVGYLVVLSIFAASKSEPIGRRMAE